MYWCTETENAKNFEYRVVNECTVPKLLRWVVANSRSPQNLAHLHLSLSHQGVLSLCVDSTLLHMMILVHPSQYHCQNSAPVLSYQYYYESVRRDSATHFNESRKIQHS